MTTIKSDPEIDRELTSHIASRWYRAPEVILLEKVYYGAVDIWGVGCVFAELLQMLKESLKFYKDRKPFFPGSSCFPLSPLFSKTIAGQIEHFDDGDQLIIICKTLGTPSEEEISFITDLGAKQYLNLMVKWKGANLRDIFPGANEEEICFLKKLLAFNPYMRITAKEALRDPYFAQIRCKSLEKSSQPILLDTEVSGMSSIEKLASLLQSKEH